MPAGDIAVISLPVTPLRTGQAPAGLAVKWHALLLAALHAHDAPLAAMLHDVQRKPFTISPLLDAPDGNPVAHVQEGTPYWLRMALIDAWLPDLLRRPGVPPCRFIDVWLRGALAALPPRLPMRADGLSPWDYLLSTDHQVPLITQSSFAAIAGAPAPHPERWCLRFRTPTTFRRPLPPSVRGTLPDLYAPLPDPDAILRTLAAAWQFWAPPALAPIAAPEHVEALCRQVEMEEHRIMAEPVMLSARERLPAFAGEATIVYRAALREPPSMRAERTHLLAALLRLAPFTGIGAKTARGMGLVTVTPAPRPLPQRRQLPAPPPTMTIERRAERAPSPPPPAAPTRGGSASA